MTARRSSLELSDWSIEEYGGPIRTSLGAEEEDVYSEFEVEFEPLRRT